MSYVPQRNIPQSELDKFTLDHETRAQGYSAALIADAIDLTRAFGDYDENTGIYYFMWEQMQFFLHSAAQQLLIRWTRNGNFRATRISQTGLLLIQESVMPGNMARVINSADAYYGARGYVGKVTHERLPVPYQRRASYVPLEILHGFLTRVSTTSNALAPYVAPFDNSGLLHHLRRPTFHAPAVDDVN